MSSLQTKVVMFRSKFREAEVPAETMAEEIDDSKFKEDTSSIKPPKMNVGKFRRQQSVGLGGGGR